MQRIRSMTISELKKLPEWEKVESPKPTTKAGIIKAITKVKRVENVNTVACPLRGHRHKLKLVEHYERPDLLIAYCENREVVQMPNPEFHPHLEDPEPRTQFSYQIPNPESKES